MPGEEGRHGERGKYRGRQRPLSSEVNSLSSNRAMTKITMRRVVGLAVTAAVVIGVLGLIGTVHHVTGHVTGASFRCREQRVSHW